MESLDPHVGNLIGEMVGYERWLEAQPPNMFALTQNAAASGNLIHLQILHERGCPWGGLICAYAAKNEHLDCLRWAREHGCPWDRWTCACAAENGDLDCLRWVREHGCPWDE